MAKTKFFRIAVEGATATDGRTITREMIEQSAAAYNPTTYTARINCEHLRGFSPEPPFNAYGSVLALKAEDFEIQIDGKPQTRRALYAQLDANSQLVATVKADQKIFTSCEFAEDFAQTKKHGLVGLAVTDNPASLGTEALSFSALKPMWDARKTAPGNFFSAAEENVFALDPANDNASLAETIKTSIASAMAKFTGGDKPKEEDKPKDEPKQAANDNFAALAVALGDSLAAALKPIADANATLQTDFATLKGKLENTEQLGFSRTPASGAPTDAKFATDC